MLGGLDPVDARDLATAGLTVVPTWVEPGVPAPVAAGAVRAPGAPSSWLRPLPGRVVEAAAGGATLRGDDLPRGVLRVATAAEVDGRGRVRPRRPLRGTVR